MNKIKAGIVGAAGYTGGETLRLLLRHPFVDIHFIRSSSSAAKKVYDIHKDLLGDTELCFDAGIKLDSDVIFLCLGHGEAASFLNEHAISPQTKVIDLSQDFRLAATRRHTAQNTERNFTYGLPELRRESIKTAANISNPGCFATAIQLALLPLANKGLLKHDIHISAVTGSTGAGQGLTPTSQFSWRSGNVSVYKAFNHQHLDEVAESLVSLEPGFNSSIVFIPSRGDFTRGILASVYTSVDIGLPDAVQLYKDFYQDHPFTWVSQTSLDLKQVVGTNKCFLSLDYKDGKLLIVSVIDNLLKGAAGQAVQNMNLMFGFPEGSSLDLKSIVF